MAKTRYGLDEFKEVNTLDDLNLEILDVYFRCPVMWTAVALWAVECQQRTHTVVTDATLRTAVALQMRELLPLDPMPYLKAGYVQRRNVIKQGKYPGLSPKPDEEKPNERTYGGH